MPDGFAFLINEKEYFTIENEYSQVCENLLRYRVKTALFWLKMPFLSDFTGWHGYCSICGVI